MPRTLDVFVLTGPQAWGNQAFEYSSLSKQALSYAKLFKGKKSIKALTSSVPLTALAGLTLFYNTEFAVCLLEDELHIVKGNDADMARGIGGSVTPLKNSRILIHVHPATASYREHIANDILVNRQGSGLPEAVVDLNLDVIVYEDGEVFNRRNVVGQAYVGLEGNDTGWPDFLNYKAHHNVEVVVPEGK